MTAPRASRALPAGYGLTERIDLLKNKRQLWLVNGLSLVLLVLVAVLGLCLRPWDWSSWSLSTSLLALAGVCLYIVGHEAVHGAAMWLFSHEKPRFGFSLMYAYAGSDAYFSKGPYLLISLAPAVLWGLLLAALTALLPDPWFWPLWIIQITNISGSAGDFYVFFKILAKPDSVLVQDTGTAMTVYERL